MVAGVLASLAEGASIPEILADFPTLTEPAVRAVIAFAAASALVNALDDRELKAELTGWPKEAAP